MPYLLYSSNVIASKNIASYLIETEFNEIDEGIFKKGDIKLINTKVKSILDINYNNVKDFAIILSPHSSESKKPTLTVHVPGNWNKAMYGGKAFTLNISYPSLMKEILIKMNELKNRRHLAYEVSYEVDHHGPTVEYPIMFAELGSSEMQWKDKKAAMVIGDAVMDALKDTPKYDVYIGIGGNHYAPKFTKMALTTDIAFSHLMAKYIEKVNDDLFKQAFEKSLEKTKGFLIDKKGLYSKTKKEVIEILKRNNFYYDMV